MKGSDLMKKLWWLGQFGRLRTLLDRDDEVNDECGDNDDDNEDAEDGDYLVHKKSDSIGGGSKQPRKRQRRNDDASYKFEEETNI